MHYAAAMHTMLVVFPWPVLLSRLEMIGSERGCSFMNCNEF